MKGKLNRPWSRRRPRGAKLPEALRFTLIVAAVVLLTVVARGCFGLG